MQKIWILSEAYQKGTNAIDQFVRVDTPPNFTGTYYNLFDSDINTLFKTSIDETTFQSINFTFSHPIRIYGYKIENVYAARYLKGWKITTSMDGSEFEDLDNRNEDFCFSNYTHTESDGEYIDCGESTSREFITQTRVARYVNLVQTAPDSCNTYAFHISTFDIFGYINQINTLRNIFKPKISPIFSFIFLFYNTK